MSKVLMRYVRNGPEWSLTGYTMQDDSDVCTGEPPTYRGPWAGRLPKHPDWLTTVLQIARMGDHFINPPIKPPDEIVWFYVNDDMQLVPPMFKKV